MSKVYFYISMSLDGFVTGPNEGDNDPRMERLHEWMFDGGTAADGEVRDEVFARTGAILLGRNMFDVGFGPWGDPPPFKMPVFVLTSRAHDSIPMQGGTTYHFVTEGVEAALEQAKAAAGGKDVGIWGGAKIAQEYLKAGLVDELQIAVVPVLLGEGIRLFEDLGPGWLELEKTHSVDTPQATHLRLTVGKRQFDE